MKTIITLLLAILAAVTTPITKPNEPPHAEAFAAEFERDFPGEAYILRKTEDVTKGVLKAREKWDVYLVAVTTGTVLNAAGDGKEDLPEPYNYISYRHMPFETKPGDRIITYLVFEIHSDGEDDIIARYDYPLDGIK